jgi:hypothetical protein
MVWASVARGISSGRTPGGKRGKPRRPRPTRPGRGRPPRKLTTSEAAIRRFEQMKRGGTGRGKSRPLPGRGPDVIRRGGHRGNDTVGGPRRRTGTVNTGTRGRPVGKGRRPTRTTSQAAIARSKARLRRGRSTVAGRVARAGRRR